MTNFTPLFETLRLLHADFCQRHCSHDPYREPVHAKKCEDLDSQIRALVNDYYDSPRQP